MTHSAKHVTFPYTCLKTKNKNFLILGLKHNHTDRIWRFFRHDFFWYALPNLFFLLPKNHIDHIWMAFPWYELFSREHLGLADYMYCNRRDRTEILSDVSSYACSNWFSMLNKWIRSKFEFTLRTQKWVWSSTCGIIALVTFEGFHAIMFLSQISF